MKSAFRMLLVLGTSSVVSGCWLSGSVAPDGDAGSAVGIYTLLSVNGQPLPALVQPSAGVTRRIVFGTFSIKGDGDTAFESVWDETVSGQTTRRSERCEGFWVRDNNSFWVQETGSFCSGRYTAEWDGGDRLTIVFSAELQSVFER